MIDKCR